MSYKDKSWNERFRTLMSFFVSLALGCVLLFGESKWEFSPILSGILIMAACIFATIGAFGRIWCSLYIAGYKNNVLVTAGPYSLCRNPLYFFSAIGAVGVGFSTESFSAPLIIAIVFALYYPSIIKREQLRLGEIFGRSFSDYCTQTPCFFPRWKCIAPQPLEYMVNPRIFTKTFIDAVWFVWLIGIIELIESFHKAGILPILFKFY